MSKPTNIRLHNLTASMPGYPHHSTLTIKADKPGELLVLGNISHNSRITFDRESAKQLIEFLMSIVEGEGS